MSEVQPGPVTGFFRVFFFTLPLVLRQKRALRALHHFDHSIFTFMTRPLSSTGRNLWLAAGLVMLAVFLAAPELMAQAAEAAEEPVKEKSFLDKLISGGSFMIPIGLLSVASITLFVYNSLQLAQGRFLPKRLAFDIHELMSSVRVRSAIDTAAANPSFYGRMMATALPHIDATNTETLGRESVEDAMAEFTTRETANSLMWVQYFSVIAQMAPMLGLLGTVWGMVGAFETLGIGKGAEPAKLASNISVALITTLGGLLVALPSIFGYHFYKNKLNARIRDVHKAASDAIDAAVKSVNAEMQMARVPEGLAEEEAVTVAAV